MARSVSPWRGQRKARLAFLRVGLIGAGTMGADHARILGSEIPGVSLQYVCDADAARAKRVANSCGIAHTTAVALAVIADRSVDAVLVASPDQTHALLSRACVEARKPVLCEKPLSQDSKECIDVIAAEVKGGKRLVQVGFMRRFDPAYVEMKAALAKRCRWPRVGNASNAPIAAAASE